MIDTYGFTPSKNDPCFYFNDGMVLVQYVDDCLMAHKSGAVMDDFIDELGKDLELTREGSWCDPEVRELREGFFPSTEYFAIVFGSGAPGDDNRN